MLACARKTGWIAAVLALLLASGALAKSAPKKMAVAGGQIVIAAPRGFCVEMDASTETQAGAFVLFGSCASLANSNLAGKPRTPAILTAVVTPGAPAPDIFSSSIGPLAEFLTSAGGRAAISRAGRAETVAIRQIVVAGDVIFIRLTDIATLAGQDVEKDYWRALFVIDGHFVTLSVLALSELPLPEEAMRDLLDQFVARVREENRS